MANDCHNLPISIKFCRHVAKIETYPHLRQSLTKVTSLADWTPLTLTFVEICKELAKHVPFSPACAFVRNTIQKILRNSLFAAQASAPSPLFGIRWRGHSGGPAMRPVVSQARIGRSPALSWVDLPERTHEAMRLQAREPYRDRRPEGILIASNCLDKIKM